MSYLLLNIHSVNVLRSLGSSSCFQWALDNLRYGAAVLDDVGHRKLSLHYCVNTLRHSHRVAVWMRMTLQAQVHQDPSLWHSLGRLRRCACWYKLSLSGDLRFQKLRARPGSPFPSCVWRHESSALRLRSSHGVYSLVAGGPHSRDHMHPQTLSFYKLSGSRCFLSE